MNAHACGARLGFERTRSRVLVVFGVLALALAAVVALLELAHDRSSATDRTLSGVVFGLCLPLYCYASFELAVMRGNLSSAIAPFARQGLARPALAQGLVAGVALQNAVFGALLAMLSVLLTRGYGHHPRLVTDLVSVSWIAALTAVAYTGLFAVGSALRRGRLLLLIGDWFLGSGTGLLALPWPRGHARNLLGFSPVLELTQASAAALLLALGLGGLLLGTRHLPR